MLSTVDSPGPCTSSKTSRSYALQEEMKKAGILPPGKKDDEVCLKLCKITKVNERGTIYSTNQNQKQPALSESISKKWTSEICCLRRQQIQKRIRQM